MTNKLTFADILKLNGVFQKKNRAKKESGVDQNNHNISKNIPVQVTQGRSLVSSESLVKKSYYYELIMQLYKKLKPAV